MYRLSVYRPIQNLLTKIGFDFRSSFDLFQLPRFQNATESIDDLFEIPFQPIEKKEVEYRPTRFSNGSFPVFYSSLEPETAEAEVKYLFLRRDKKERVKTLYYTKFSVDFDGTIQNLVSKKTEWPKPIHDSDYAFCNQLAKSAKKLGLAGLIVPSARSDGINLPVFSRKSLNNPKIFDILALPIRPIND